MNWNTDGLLELARGYQGTAVLAAAADLDLFSALASESLTGPVLARRLSCDLRGLTILLDALTALQLLVKEEDRYSLSRGADACLTASGPHSILAMAQHQANCLRQWVQLARVVKTGQPAERSPSVRGEKSDQEAFIGAMHNVSAPVADQVIGSIQPLQFRTLLDIGGASGTWTRAFLRACPASKAMLFDLPEVIPLARRLLAEEAKAARVKFVAGDFMTDPLPPGADLAWVSAIVHQNSRKQNCQLFAKAFQALMPAGRIVIRDVLMHATHTHPVAGALFAVNMLMATEGGGTYTFEELREDLMEAGFAGATVVRQDEGMNSVLVAEKPSHP
jgi:SAM-dependent methyltransferase